jgi:hypothetical protein
MSRITRNTQTPPPVRSTPPAKSHAKPPAKSHANGTTTPATNTPANQTTATNRVHELTQDARFVRAGLERTLTTQAVIEAYQAVIDAYRLSSDTGALSPIAAARELARRLQNGDDNFRKQLMREFLLHPDLSDVDRAQILQAAGGDTLPASSRTPITEDERQIIVQSLGQLYQGAVNDRALQNALSRIVEMEFAMAQGPGNPFTDSPGRIARLIAESGSPRLKELYAIAIFERLDGTTGSQLQPQDAANQVRQSANQVRQSYGNPQGQTYPINAARELARQLSQTNDPQFRQQLMAELAKDPEIFADILRAAGGEPFQNLGNQRDGTEPINDGERRVIARSLGSAYEAGLITEDTVRQVVAVEPSLNWRMGSANGDFVGLLIAQSSSNELMRDYATAVLEYVSDSPSPHPSHMCMIMLNSAARAMAGSPEVLNEMIKRLANNEFAGKGVNTPITLSDFIKELSNYLVPDFAMPVFSVTSITALGDILTTAAQAQASLMVWKDRDGYVRNTIMELFKETIAHGRLDQLNIYDAGVTVLEALTYLYRCQAHAITDFFLAQTNDAYDKRFPVLASFFQHTLFNSSASNETKERLIDTLGAIGRDYRAQDVPKLGRLAGTIMGGYALRVEQQQEREKATRELVATLVGIMPLPGPLNKMLGDLGVEASDLLKDVIKNIDGTIAREARAELVKQLTGILSDRLTERGGFLGLGGWQVRSGGGLATILNTMFDFENLPDDDGDQRNGNGLKDGYKNGMGQVLEALRLQKLKLS